MTLSSKLNTQAPIATLLNLSTRHRSFMVLHNPNRVVRADWSGFFQIMEWTLAYVGPDKTAAERLNEVL